MRPSRLLVPRSRLPAKPSHRGMARSLRHALSSLPKTPSQNVTINLINRLVQRGVLTHADADELIKQAEEDADSRAAQAAAVQQDAAVAREQATAAQSAAAAAVVPPLPEPDDTVRVTYVPEIVKQQMRDEIKQEVMAQARAENWAAPHTFPDWVSNIRLFGDLRLRYEGQFFPSGNDNTGSFPNFNAINTGAPIVTNPANANYVFPAAAQCRSGSQPLPDSCAGGRGGRSGRGIHGRDADATGENNSPVTQNQSLGAANSAQGRQLQQVCDLAGSRFFKYQLTGKPDKDLIVSAGRFDNPFFSTPMIWDSNLGMDGAAVHAKYEVAHG